MRTLDSSLAGRLCLPDDGDDLQLTSSICKRLLVFSHDCSQPKPLDTRAQQAGHHVHDLVAGNELELYSKKVYQFPHSELDAPRICLSAEVKLFIHESHVAVPALRAL